MEDEIVSFETAMLLKEKGFNEPCCRFYEDGRLNEIRPYAEYETLFVSNDFPNKRLYAPTQSLAQRWLRETHHITFNANPHSNNGEIVYVVTIKVISNKKHVDFNVMMDTSNRATMFDTYEEALEEGLKYCLKSI